jgi:hypothetical protein
MEYGIPIPMHPDNSAIEIRPNLAHYPWGVPYLCKDYSTIFPCGEKQRTQDLMRVPQQAMRYGVPCWYYQVSRGGADSSDWLLASLCDNTKGRDVNELF